jgi:kumamolisin
MTYTPAHLIPETVVDPATGQTPYAIPVNGYLTPPQIATAYSIPTATGLGVKIGIFSFGGGFLQSDLNKSFSDLQTAGLISSSYTVPTVRQVLLDGQTGTFSVSPDTGSGENTVDIYCAACMAPQAQITIYIGNYISSMVSAAIADGIHIVTISWGGNEYNGDEQYFQQLATAKITCLASSGDYGSVVRPTSNALGVVYPSASPYVISAGGTKLTLNSGTNTRASETDDNRDTGFGTTWGGGGGLSVLFDLPTWQTGLYYTPITNSVRGSATALNARGLPDFSAPMNAYAVYVNGSIGGYGGTSLSCPTLAGILARYLQLTGVKRSAPDWNTIAYANPSAFYDITVGTNNTKITSGYAGTSGWDPVTGLGPPIGTALYQAIRTGTVFPKRNYGFRSSTGPTYPRQTTIAR